jgi:hypothetical protein
VAGVPRQRRARRTPIPGDARRGGADRVGHHTHTLARVRSGGARSARAGGDSARAVCRSRSSPSTRSPGARMSATHSETSRPTRFRSCWTAVGNAACRRFDPGPGHVRAYFRFDRERYSTFIRRLYRRPGPEHRPPRHAPVLGSCRHPESSTDARGRAGRPRSAPTTRRRR